MLSLIAEYLPSQAISETATYIEMIASTSLFAYLSSSLDLETAQSRDFCYIAASVLNLGIGLYRKIDQYNVESSFDEQLKTHDRFRRDAHRVVNEIQEARNMPIDEFLVSYESFWRQVGELNPENPGEMFKTIFRNYMRFYDISYIEVLEAVSKLRSAQQVRQITPTYIV